MRSTLSDRVAVVTGAGRGLGRVEALELAAQGAAVLVNDVRDADATTAEIVRRGGTAEADHRDVSTWAGAEGLVGHAVEAFGDLHVLVNNAGIVRDGMSFGLSEAAWDAVVDVDLKGHAGPARFAAAYWRERHKAGVRAPRRLVNTTSESGLYGSVGQANYAAAKAGVAALTLVLAGELARYGVTVNAIAPRARTPMSEAAFGTLARDADVDGVNGVNGQADPWAPEQVARIVAWLASDAAADVSGQVLVVFGETVQLLAGWSVARTVRGPGGWTPSSLDDLARRLFGDGGGRREPFAVRTLFTAGAQPAQTLEEQR